jgi:hypothetical protein
MAPAPQTMMRFFQGMPTLTEPDACRNYVLPKLYAVGWDDDQFSEQRTFTDGRIVVAGSKVTRRPLGY